ncbi:unnamed protein product [Ophioblennius macclurei]
MSAPDTQRLVGGPYQQTTVEVENASTRNTRAYKVAGITLLAVVLIVGQAAIAYFLIGQRSDIKSLREQNEQIRDQMTKTRSVSVPMRMQMPISSLTADFLEEESSSEGTKKEPAEQTSCQLEKAGLKPVQVPGFVPACDSYGLYAAQQCFAKECWCVNPMTGEQIPESLRMGPARCSYRGLRAPLPALDIQE